MRDILILFVGLLSAPLLALASSYDYGVDINTIAGREGNSSRVLVEPLPKYSNGSLPVRIEILELRKDSYKWDLFILALSMFQDMNQDDPVSWYQIAGIHGVPFVSWNNVDPVDGGEQSGYCPHNSPLFPTWHRPYLALVEQEMHRLANIIAKMFTDDSEREAYEEAASDFRMPFWDWSVQAPDGEEQLPEIFWHPTISGQNGPKGKQNVRNPLFSYQFHPKDKEAFVWSPMNVWAETKRGPNTTENETAPTSHNDQVSDALVDKLPEIQQRLFILFSSYKDYNTFGNKAWASYQNSTEDYDSIESIHDIIHIYGGLKGDMTYVPLSAFDPLFFFHHINTDRLIAIWQALNPNSWMSPAVAGETSFTTLKGDSVDAETALTPFYATENGTFWNSDMARTTEAFGYTYPDTDSSGMSDQELRDELNRKINNWWGGSSAARLQAQQANTRRDPNLIGDLVEGRLHFGGGIPDLKLTVDLPPAYKVIVNGQYTEWIANVIVNAEALGGNFGIYFFLGAPPANTEEWEKASNLIGTVAIFTMSRQTGSESKITGTTPLTSALLKMVTMGEIPHLGELVVDLFLKETLQFRVLANNGTEVDPKAVSGLRVGISSCDVKVAEKDTELPEWGTKVERIQLW